MDVTQLKSSRLIDPAEQLASTSSRLQGGNGLIDRFVGVFAGIPPWAVLVQLFFGLGWLRASTEKIIDSAWWRGDVVELFVLENEPQTVGWFSPFLDAILVMPTSLVAALLLIGQILVGVCLILNRGVRVALTVAIVMNVAFVATGSVNPSAFYLVGQGALLVALVPRDDPRLRTSIWATLAFAAVNIPFIDTIHPADVINDPAIMLVTVSALYALAARLVLVNGPAHNSILGRSVTTA